MLKNVLLVLLALFVAVVVVGFFLPTTYAVERRITIDAGAERVHALVGDLERWPLWTPWAAADPSMTTTLGDSTTGVGASQRWSGKDGDGELTFTESDPATGIAYDMAFIDGDLRAPAVSAMRYEPSGEGTTVVWTMSGDSADFAPPVVGGYVNLMMPAMIGDMFDQGLEKLKEVAESDLEIGAGPAEAR